MGHKCDALLFKQILHCSEVAAANQKVYPLPKHLIAFQFFLWQEEDLFMDISFDNLELHENIKND
jgi:uncharacterized protein Usg